MPPPRRIILLRHAEKPEEDLTAGVAEDGTPDPSSLSPRGWQRAGALIRLLTENSPPDAIYAAASGSQGSRRPLETVTPLADACAARRDTPLITSFTETDHETAAADILTRDGTVIVCWEHKELPALAAQFAAATTIPPSWPSERFDMLWILEPDGSTWRLTQTPQRLLAGDLDSNIG